MEKLKGKYEIILGFVTLIISLSAFKDELTKIKINTLFFHFTLSEYFLCTVCGFSICLYLYIIEHVVRDTKIGNWKIFDTIIKLAYFFFVFILLSPFFVLLMIAGTEIYIYVSRQNIQQDLSLSFLKLFFLLITAFLPFFVNLLSNQLYTIAKEKMHDQVEEQQIREIENANRLFNDGYFSLSILESFKVIEGFLYKKIIERGIRVQQNRFPDLIRIALNESIVTLDEATKINDVRGMRNAAAHTNAAHTKQQAEFAFGIVRDLLSKE